MWDLLSCRHYRPEMELLAGAAGRIWNLDGMRKTARNTSQTSWTDT